MNTLKSLLSSGGIGLLTDECASVYLDDFDVLNVDCAKATISKALGLAIITASTIVKLPQILNMLKAKSAAGLSFVSTALELFPCATIIGYALAQDFPFSSWGESLFMALQTALIAFLICSYNGQTTRGVLFIAAYFGFILVLVQGLISVETLALMQMSNVPIIVISRLIQVIANYKNGHTGQLSFITCFMMFAGGCARIFTSLQETGDLILIINFSSGAAMSSIILGQLIYYKEATAKLGEKQD